MTARSPTRSVKSPQPSSVRVMPPLEAASANPSAPSPTSNSSESAGESTANEKSAAENAAWAAKPTPRTT